MISTNTPERIKKKRDITQMELVLGNEWVKPRLDIPVLGQSSLSGKESAQGCLPKRLLGRPD